MFINRKLFSPLTPPTIVLLVKVYIWLKNIGVKKKSFFIKSPLAQTRINPVGKFDLMDRDSIEEYYLGFTQRHFILDAVQCYKGDSYWYSKFYPFTKIGYKVKFNSIKW